MQASQIDEKKVTVLLKYKCHAEHVHSHTERAHSHAELEKSWHMGLGAAIYRIRSI